MGVIAIFTGSTKSESANSDISVGIVAEKRSVCFLEGILSIIYLYIMNKSHIQHSVSFIQNKYFYILQIDQLLIY